MMKNTILMFCYARSGGTLLNQCLGSLPNTIIMSEVNSTGGGGTGDKALRTVNEQASVWYNIPLDSKIFEESIIELNEICRRNNKKLVIRDWSFVNFVPISYNNFNPPGKLLTFENFNQFEGIKSFALVRDAVDVWLSLKNSPKKNYDPNLEYLLEYVKELKRNKIKIFKYEDFCVDPDKIMFKICKYTGLKYNKSYKRYASFLTLNGDVDLASYSRGIQQKKIAPLKRRCASAEDILQLENNSRMKEVNTILGYPTKY